MNKRLALLALLLAAATVHATTVKVNRVPKYAAFKAHQILPDSLRFLVKRHGKALFAGVERGLQTPLDALSADLIMAQNARTTQMIGEQRPFREVVHQMGYVSGLLAAYTAPNQTTSTARQGFKFYLNRKLGRFHFVFDGYQSVPDKAALKRQLQALGGLNSRHESLLGQAYRNVGNNPRHIFSEQSSVFGICSLYYSNLARMTAHLWYHAWLDANGDVTRTPFVERQKHPAITP